jgi:hypothetical protein
MNVAYNYTTYLQKYERAPCEFMEIEDGKETQEFLSIWFHPDEKSSTFNNAISISEIVNDWNNWYRDVKFNFLFN